MKPNQSGFSYPTINQKKCIRCYKCLSVCAFKADQEKKDVPNGDIKSEAAADYPIVYAVKHKNFDMRMASRSGGIFGAVSDAMLEDGGVVYGCAMDGVLKASHIRAETKEERDRMHGSKYIQSDMSDIFRQVQEDLKAGRKVLFSGTSCQVTGLQSFLEKDYNEQLFCLDILCHGVPSPLVWEKYVQWREELCGRKCVAADFRNKKEFGWKEHVETLVLEKPDGTKKIVHSKVFRSLFYSHLIIRRSCYRCPYKDITHSSDMTIGDFWTIQKAVPGFDDNCGVSLVLLNTQQAVAMFDAIKENLEFSPCSIEDSMQIPLKRPFHCPEGYDEFWRDFKERPFDYIAKAYGHYRRMDELRLALIAKKAIRKR